MSYPCPRCGGDPIRVNGAGHLAWCPACCGVEDAPPDVLPIRPAPTFVPAPADPPQSERTGLVAQLADRVQQLRQQYHGMHARTREHADYIGRVKRDVASLIASADAVARTNLALRQRLDQAEAERDAARLDVERLRNYFTERGEP